MYGSHDTATSRVLERTGFHRSGVIYTLRHVIQAYTRVTYF